MIYGHHLQIAKNRKVVALSLSIVLFSAFAFIPFEIPTDLHQFLYNPA